MTGPKRPKCRDWERERRERLNKSFFELSRLLPDHDPTLPLSKVDIITKATSYIKHLQDQNMKLMENSENSDTQKKEVMQLKQRISDLLRRTRQLAELLQTANVPIPTELPAGDFSGPMQKPMKWSGRLRQDAAKELLENVQKRREEKEKQKKEKQLVNKAKMKSKSIVLKRKAKCKKMSAMLPSVLGCFIKDQNMTAVPQVLNVDFNLSSHLNTSNVSTPLREINNPLPPNKIADCVTAYSKTITLPCTTTVSIVISNSKPDQVVTVAKSNILTAPIMATGIQPVLERNPALTNLGPGTLILPDGRIMPVPGPQTQTVLQAPAQYIVNRPVNQPAVIVMQNIGTTLKPSLSQKSQRLIVPKPKKKDSTKTTFVNKLPIPAISTQQPTSISVTNNLTKINNISTANPAVVKRESITNKKAQMRSVKSRTRKVKQKSLDKNVNQNKTNSKVSSKVNNTEKARINSNDPSASRTGKALASELSKNEKTNGNTSKRSKNSSKLCTISKRAKTVSQKHKETENNEAVNSGDKLGEDISSNSNNDITGQTVLKSDIDVQAENKSEVEYTKQKEQNTEVDVENMSKCNKLQRMHNDTDIVINKNSNSNNNDTNNRDRNINDDNTVCSNNSNTTETLVTCEKPDSGTQKLFVESDKMEEEKSVVDKPLCHNQQVTVDNKESSMKSNSTEVNKPITDNNSAVEPSGPIHNNDKTVNCVNKTDKVHHDYYSDNHKSSVKTGASSSSVIESNKQNCTATFPINKGHHTDFILLNGNVSPTINKSSDVKIDKAVGHTVNSGVRMGNNYSTQADKAVGHSANSGIIMGNNCNTQPDKAVGHTINSGVRMGNNCNTHADKAVGHSVNSGVRMGNNCNTQASSSVSTGSNTDQPLGVIGADKTVQHTAVLMGGVKNTSQQKSGPGEVDKNICHVSDLVHSDKHSLPSSGVLQNSNQQSNFGTSKIDNCGSGNLITQPAKDTRQFTELSHGNKDIKQNNGSGQFNNLLPVDKMQQSVYVDTRHNQISDLVPMRGQNMAQSDKITSIMNTDKNSQIAVNSQIVNLQFDKVSKQIDHIGKLTQPSDLMKTDNSGHSSVNLNSSKESGQIINLTSNEKINNSQINNETDTTQKLQMYQENIFRDSTQNRDRNTFIPVNHSCMDDVRLSLPHSEFSNDLFTSLQVPSTGQHPESISPTAAFLLAFPLVSTSKTSEMLVENDNSDSQHATPTTILQIGNIDPPGTELYHSASPIIMDNSINTFHNLKPKNNGNKNNENTKHQHLKSVENFDRYQQQFDINERYQDNFQSNQNFSHSHSTNETNCKQRKVNFLLNQEQEMYNACNKKKNNDRVCSYPAQTNSEICGYPDKSFERMEFHHSENIAHEATSESENQKKSNTLPLLNSSAAQNTYTQPSYNLFSSSNDYPLGISSQYTTAQSTIETTKSLQPPSNFSILPWTCSTTASSSLNHNDYVSLYTSFPQSIHNKNHNFSTGVKNNSQKSQTFDNRMKDKSASTSLSKFPGNFPFTDQPIPRQQQDGTSSHYQANDVSSYKVDNKNKKPKSLPRPPVNWMTAPDIRPVLPDHTPTPIIPDVMFPPQKDIDFSVPQTNSVLNSCNNIPSFNISTSISNTSQTFYSNSHFSGLEIPLDLPPLPEITTNTSKPHRPLNNASNNHHYSWSPSKSTMPSLLPHIDNHNLMIPSTLPTLVGDLALGTNTGPSTPAENSFKNFNLPNTFSQTNENTNKKYESRQQELRKVQGKSPDRDCVTASNSDRRNLNRTMPDYCNKTHSHQSTNTSGSFLSVSQLVDHAKSEGRNVSRRVNKQSQAKQTLQKRNSNIQQQTEKQNTVNKNGHSINYSGTGNMNNIQRKTEINYSDDRNMGINFSGSFPATNHIPSSTGLWNSNEKSARNPAGGQYKGGSYSAESLIGVNQEQDNITDIPGSFPITNQYNSHYSQPQKSYIDSSIVCSTNNYTSDFSHQNLQHSEFSHQQTQHTYQNCFNFSTQNSIYTSTNTAPFISDNDYQIALDPSYVFHHPVTNVNKSHNQACQTTSNNKDTHRQVTHSSNNSKRNSANNKRRDDYSSMGPNQTTPFLQSSDIYQPSHYANTCRSAVSSSYQPASCITSSPPHHGTTTLTNFNLSTIFPEINDKRTVSGANTFHSNKHTDSSTTSVQPSVRNEFVPSTDTVNTQLPPIRTEFNNILSAQQPVVSLHQQVPSSHFSVEGFSNIPPPFQVHQ